MWRVQWQGPEDNTEEASEETKPVSAKHNERAGRRGEEYRIVN